MWHDDDKDQFFKQLAVLAETLGEPMSPVRLAGYCSALEDLPLEGVALAMQDAMKACIFFPKPAELRQLMADNPEWRRRQIADRKASEARDEQARQRLLPSRTAQEDAEARAKFEVAFQAFCSRKRIPEPAPRKALAKTNRSARGS